MAPGNSNNCKCQKDKTGQGIPLGGPWAAYWTGMMIVLGLSLGVYYLANEEHRSRPPLGGIKASILFRAFLVVGLVVGGTASSAAYGFEVARQCTSTLSVLVPWTVYVVGLFLATGLLTVTYRVVTGRSPLSA